MLIYIPVIHTGADIGSLGAILGEQFTLKYGGAAWEGHRRAIEEMWKGLTQRIHDLNLNWPSVRIYQDGLPVCGREKDMIRDMVGKGSYNFALIQSLLDKGAQVEGTESPFLLLKEYDHMKSLAEAKTDRDIQNARTTSEKMERELLFKRDRFICGRINQTLRAEETGILFIGLFHEVDQWLAKDITVRYLIHRLPFKRQFQITGV